MAKHRPLGRNKQLSVIAGPVTIPFEVAYSPHRCTIQITVRPPGQVVVTAPARCPDHELLSLVARKACWITGKLEIMRSVPREPVARELIGGEMILYLGREYQLNLQQDGEARKPTIVLDADRLTIQSQSLDQAYLRAHLIDWYSSRATERIGERVRHFSKVMGVAPKAVTIKNQKTRWGSCTSNGKLHFNWRSVLAPPDVIDYIVVHELCHLLEMNHSSRFWSQLKAVLPDYEVQKKWLKANGVGLDVSFNVDKSY